MRSDDALLRRLGALLLRLLLATLPVDEQGDKENQAGARSAAASKSSSSDCSPRYDRERATAQRLLAYEVHALTAFFLTTTTLDHAAEIQSSTAFGSAL